MKTIILLFILAFAETTGVLAQDQTTLYEWNLSGTTPTTLGERVVAYINATTIGSYTGASIVGQVIDANSNWGYTMPTVANFKLSINFSGSSYQLQQDVVTNNVTLELKSISPTEVALVANCPNAWKQIRILFRMSLANGPTVTLGSSTTVTSTGTMLVTQPTYTSSLTGRLALNVANNSKASAYTLAVGGKAIAESVTVQMQSSWPDYVFKKDYQLPSLTEVKTYIDQNHHLPDMPSEQQVAKDGLNLGEMNKLLTKKVEELTLYLIEKDKQLKSDSNKIKTDEYKIKELEGRMSKIEDVVSALRKNN